MDKINTTTTKRAIIAATFASLLYIGQSSAAVISVFTDQALWESAVGNFTIETFDDSLLNREISVTSTAGDHSVSSGVFNGLVFEDDTVALDTNWSFTGPILAFGGNWDLSPGSPGTGLEIALHSPDDFFLVAGRPDIANTYTGGFWGILSDTPFNAIQILSGDSGIENYTLDNLVYSKIQVPEPNSLLLLALGLIGLLSFGGPFIKNKERKLRI
ncbi:MAG: PEP-CTERM sorting domain-containing protein [Gammaproteobacteria bacterium]|nr:PEP-CTERM sorting domain-containing protein [Gammaproteobacteria bacterium]